MDDELRLLFNEKPVKILLTVKNVESTNMKDLATEADTTYSHGVRIVGKLADSGIVERERDGREKLVVLTEKGKQLADAVETTVDQLCEIDVRRGNLEGEYWGRKVVRCGSCDAEIPNEPEDLVESAERREVVSHKFNDPKTGSAVSTKTYYCDPQCFVDAFKDGKVRKVKQ